jgi:glycosyltransferase involved in cell wall biosynthesis
MAATPARVLVLSKRQYMSKDLLDDRYGRFRELPLAMAGQGAVVQGLCLSYRRRPQLELDDVQDQASVHWRSLNLPRLLPFGRDSYWRTLDRLGEEFRPELVWACSDVPHARLGVAAARRLRIPLALDLYDNFESYPLARLPGVNAALRAAVARADGVSCISTPLATLLREGYGYRGPIEVIGNAVPAGLFHPHERSAARARFGLPHDATLVGTAGAISRTRGIDCLFEAFAQLAARRPGLRLVLAGPVEKGLRLPSSERVHYLGQLPASEVPLLLSALDVSVVGNRDSAFGRYCFPQKLYESLACGVPVAVARVGAAAELLRDSPGNLYAPDDAASLARTIDSLCESPVLPALPVPTWATLAQRLLPFLSALRTR